MAGAVEVLTLPFRLPFLPVQGVIKLGELIQDEAERQLYDPARVRRELEEAQRQRDAGQISDEELSQTEDELTTTLTTEAAASPAGESDSERADPDG